MSSKSNAAGSAPHRLITHVLDPHVNSPPSVSSFEQPHDVPAHRQLKYSYRGERGVGDDGDSDDSDGPSRKPTSPPRVGRPIQIQPSPSKYSPSKGDSRAQTPNAMASPLRQAPGTPGGLSVRTAKMEDSGPGLHHAFQGKLTFS